MAKKMVKKEVNIKQTDDTFLQECRAMIHFNNACNTEIVIDTEAMTASIQVIDHVHGKTYRGAADLQEME